MIVEDNFVYLMDSIEIKIVVRERIKLYSSTKQNLISMGAFYYINPHWNVSKIYEEAKNNLEIENWGHVKIVMVLKEIKVALIEIIIWIVDLNSISFCHYSDDKDLVVSFIINVLTN